MCSAVGGAGAPESRTAAQPSRAAAQAKLYFRNPLLSHVRLSPDGSKIAAVFAQDGTESLVVRPSRSSHLGMPGKLREAMGITDRLIRVSVGIEDAEELIDDMRAALELEPAG